MNENQAQTVPTLSLWPTGTTSTFQDQRETKIDHDDVTMAVDCINREHEVYDTEDLYVEDELEMGDTVLQPRHPFVMSKVKEEPKTGKRKLSIEEQASTSGAVTHTGVKGRKQTQPFEIAQVCSVHTGERPFNCTTCNAKFNQAIHLTNHMRLHTGERPFSCTTCDAKFSLLACLKRLDLKIMEGRPTGCGHNFDGVDGGGRGPSRGTGRGVRGRKTTSTRYNPYPESSERGQVEAVPSIETDPYTTEPGPSSAAGASTSMGSSILQRESYGSYVGNYDDDKEQGMDRGSDAEEMHCDESEDVRQATTNIHSVLPEDIDPRLLESIHEMDQENDEVIRRHIPSDTEFFDRVQDTTQFKPNREVFTGTPGPTFPVSDLQAPVDAFLKIWDTEIIDHIVIETNRYAQDYIVSGISQHSRFHAWKPTTKEEIYIYFAVQILQSVNPLPVLCPYLSMPYFKEIMSYNRFPLLTKFLHFTDNSSFPEDLSIEHRKL